MPHQPTQAQTAAADAAVAQSDLQTTKLTVGGLSWIGGAVISIISSIVIIVTGFNNLSARTDANKATLETFYRERLENVARRDKEIDLIRVDIITNATKDNLAISELQTKIAQTTSNMADIKTSLTEVRVRQDDSFALLQKIEARMDRDVTPAAH